MKKYPGIDYQFRPLSYWRDDRLLQAILRGVKGTLRRRMITDYWNTGRYQEVSENLKQAALTRELRRQLGAIHPSFMGGEYLPDCADDESEIARVELRSTTFDVISIRARPDDYSIRYSIVDEYQTEFDLYEENSREPFTLAELIAFIDGSTEDSYGKGLALSYNEMNADGGPRERYRDFTRISSEFYLQLREHYEHVFDDWIKEDEGEPEQTE